MTQKHSGLQWSYMDKKQAEDRTNRQQPLATGGMTPRPTWPELLCLAIILALMVTGGSLVVWAMIMELVKV